MARVNVGKDKGSSKWRFGFLNRAQVKELELLETGKKVMNESRNFSTRKVDLGGCYIFVQLRKDVGTAMTFSITRKTAKLERCAATCNPP